MKEKQKTAIYMRLSAEDMDLGEKKKTESNSISSQRKQLLEYVQGDPALAPSEVLEFCDDGFSGTNMERPGMQEMLKQVRQNRIGCILVKDMSRFSRDYIEMGSYLNQIFPFMGVDFISVNDGYDSRKQEGNAIAIDTAFQTLLYDLYSKDISVKMKASIQTKCADGQYVFGQVPLGYEKSQEIKNAVLVNEREAKIVRYIFSMALEGMSCPEIARRLFEEGVPTTTQLRRPAVRETKKHLTWSPTTIRKILKNRFYLGEMAYGKSVRQTIGDKNGIKVPEGEWKVIVNHHEPLVTPEVFACVARSTVIRCAKPSEKSLKRKRHPLIGKIYCGGCGYAMNYTGLSGGREIGYFGCERHAVLQSSECCTSFYGTVMEETVLMLLNRELMIRGDILRQRKGMEEFQGSVLKNLENKELEYRKQYQDMYKEKNSLYIEYVGGKLKAQEYRARADELTACLEEVSHQLEKTEAEYRRLKDEMCQDKGKMEQIIRFAHMEELTREMVDIFIKKIIVYKDKRVEIEWNASEPGEIQ